MVAEHFEVAVMGHQPAGLLVAAQLARAGRRVVVMETADEAVSTPARPLGGDATGHILTVLEAQAPHLRPLHVAMGLSGPVTRPHTHQPLPAACRTQAIFARGRVALVGERPAAAQEADAPTPPPLAAEWAAEFAQADAPAPDWALRMAEADRALAALLAQLPDGPPTQLWDRWRAREIDRALRAWQGPVARWSAYDTTTGPAPDAAHALLMAALPFGAGCPEGRATRLQAARLWGRLLAGSGLCAEVEGGRALVPDFLAGAQRAGAHVASGQPIVRLEGGRRRIEVCELAGRRGGVGADLFVLNTASGACTLPAAGALATRLARAFAAQRTPVAHLAHLRLQVPRVAVPSPLAPVALLVNGRGPRGGAPADPPLCLRRSQAQGDDEVLEVLCPLPAPDDAQARRQALTHILPRVRRVVPHLPTEAGRQSWASHASPLFAPPSGGSGWQALVYRGQLTPVANLVDARADVVCGLGVEGPYLLAQLTVQALRRAAGGAWRQRHDS